MQKVVWEYVNPIFGQWADHDVESVGSRRNYVFRAQSIPYDWVPEQISRSQTPIIPPDVTGFYIPTD